MENITQSIKAYRNVSHTNLNTLVQRVVVILSSPRSGSSLIKSVLETHPDIASLDGEIEPFLILSENGFGYNSDSDAIDVLSNKDEFIDNVLDDLTISSPNPSFTLWLKERWRKRLLLQFPCLFAEGTRYRYLNRLLDEIFSEVSIGLHQNEKVLQSQVLTRVFQDEAWRINFYDGHHHVNPSTFFPST